VFSQLSWLTKLLVYVLRLYPLFRKG